MRLSGLDLEFVLMKAFRPELKRCIAESRDKILEAIKHRASEDAWKPQKVSHFPLRVFQLNTILHIEY